MDLLEIKKKLVKGLSIEDLTELTITLTEYLETISGADISAEEIADKRFAEGLVCPHCNKKHIVKNGKARGKQIDYRGISHEQTCVSTAIDRNGGLVVVPVCMGRKKPRC